MNTALIHVDAASVNCFLIARYRRIRFADDKLQLWGWQSYEAASCPAHHQPSRRLWVDREDEDSQTDAQNQRRHHAVSCRR